MIYRFTLCERGGVEIASCRLTCDAEFADGFERAMYLRIDDDSQYIVRESIGESAPETHPGPSRPGASLPAGARGARNVRLLAGWRASRPAPSP